MNILIYRDETSELPGRCLVPEASIVSLNAVRTVNANTVRLHVEFEYEDGEVLAIDTINSQSTRDLVRRIACAMEREAHSRPPSLVEIDLGAIEKQYTE